ncbi:hypothetical protein [Cohnella abietis]|uniref:Uncharacterized protein n=1 Tax=Cohnella abietis TaxID=2507935 RepID=A0A3T1DDT0_9BACL|nr:hypothetical protein [Cohnella abietis]BBI36290.1 hypothetical protein KCTCHS21_56890 [Cohnella abietis]
MAMEKRLIVKGGVGRALLDTSKLGCGFTLEPSERGWKMEIEDVSAEMAESLKGLVEEIHFFYYEDDKEQQSHQKWWLSDLKYPLLAYDSDNSLLTIEVSERVGFTVDSSEHVAK